MMRSWQALFIIILIFGSLTYLSYRPVLVEQDNSLPPAAINPKEPLSLSEDVLTFCADQYMPLTGGSGSDQEGYAIDLLREVYEPLGYKVNYLNAPWRRCVRDARDGLVSAIVGASGEEAPDFTFPQKRIGTIDFAIFLRADDEWTYAGTDSLRERRLGVVRDYEYTDDLDSYILSHFGSERILAISDEDPVAKLIELLLTGRIDLFIEDTATVDFFLQNHPDDAEKVKRISNIDDSTLPMYVAFSPILPTSDYLASLFDLRASELEKNGFTQSLLNRYLPRKQGPEIVPDQENTAQ